MMITSMYTLDSVVLAFAVTTLSCVGIVIFSMTTKRDITRFDCFCCFTENEIIFYLSMLGFMFIASLVLILFGFFAIIWTMIFHTRTLYMVCLSNMVMSKYGMSFSSPDLRRSWYFALHGVLGHRHSGRDNFVYHTYLL
jgi:hypothetical protein